MLQVLNGLRCTNAVQTSLLLANFRKEGKEKIMVVADFDYTLTRRYGDNGDKGCLTHEVFHALKDGGVGSTVATLHGTLNEHYDSMMSHCTSKDDRTSLEVEWWNASHGVIIDSKLHRDQLSGLVRHSKLIWRKNVFQFMKLLEEMSIPLLIYSAGIADIIEEAIRQLLEYFPNNITIAANRMHFDKSGYISGFTTPPVCSLNKTIAHLRSRLLREVDDIYLSRTNVVLIGDSETDACMVDGWKKKQLKIALLEKEMPHLQSFDIIIRGSDCTRLIEIFKFITSPQHL